ncbi:C40 family peptidase [Homoserinimonas sp. OAct 916]|uniref:C40 family peptidase n=1 Tax=Homoserinimonas sp. OAct 916 TaxID=2211450 RepID=UPI0013004973|nr:NlpC/P60 family protein [Homoserinimonas sp. OAct 916]
MAVPSSAVNSIDVVPPAPSERARRRRSEDAMSLRARVRRITATGGVLAACMGMMVAFAVPAQAAQTGVFDGQFAAHNRLLQQLEAQTLTTTNISAPLSVVRDGVKATSQEELDAAAEEKRLEQERAAEAERQAELANSASVASSDSGASSGSGGSSPATYAGPQSYSGGGVIGYASQFVGVVPYGTGNHPSDSFSCDGYTQYVFAGVGIYLPRGADAQGSMGTQISQSEAVAGDLVWWPGQHIGIYDGAGGMYDSPDWGRTVQHRQGSLWGSPVFVRL